jgi:2-C-methyl-D-erythritol 4-phosphate cytidylyltransferase
MNYVIILAGGIGSRLGAQVPKQFVEVLGKPVIAYTMEHFQRHPKIDAIELVCVDGYQDQLKAITEKYGITKLLKIVKGGSEYERSIINGVAGLEGIAKPNDIVMIHWAASPFLSEEMITDNIRVCKKKGNAITASYSYLLYGTNNGECAKKSINRESFMTLSAPQSFLYHVIVDIYNQVEERKMFNYVEAHTPAFMAELGIPIYFSKGSHTNIKITTMEDIDLFLGYLLAKKYKNENPDECV